MKARPPANPPSCERRPASGAEPIMIIAPMLGEARAAQVGRLRKQRRAMLISLLGTKS